MCFLATNDDSFSSFFDLQKALKPRRKSSNMKGSRLSERYLIYGCYRQSARNIPASEKEWTSDLLCVLRRREFSLLLKYIFVVSKKFFACAFFSCSLSTHTPSRIRAGGEDFMFKEREEKKLRRIIIKFFFIVLLKHNVEVMPVKEKRETFFTVPAVNVLVKTRYRMLLACYINLNFGASENNS